ncbi:MAG: SusC/RagA family TonB-linked outer membrane protein [Lutibacter sp.]
MKTKYNAILTLLLAFLVQITFAQEKTVTGKVSDASGPLPGVTVLIKGTKTGTQTDFDGNFSIKATTGAVLQFSFIGYSTTEQTVGASNVLNVSMKESAEALEEVIVMGYGTQRKTEITGSTVQVNADAIEQVPVASVDQVLQGKVAGLVFSGSSGTPGSASNIRIRGVSSITAGNEPLYVIDGVPMSNPNVSATSAGSSLSALSSLNSANIESITVLKDASATAAYGARGANGVIVITTKAGKSGKTTFNFSSSYGVSNDATDGPTVLTGAQRMELAYEAAFNTYGVGYNFTKDQAGNFYDQNLGSEFADWRSAGSKEGNWAKVITNKDAPIQEYNLSASGGDETSNFYTALGYFKQEATVIGSSFDRVSGSLNFGKDLSSKIKLSTRNSAAHSFQDGLLENSAYFSSPRAVKYFMPANEQPYNDDGTINVFNTSLPNPLWIAQEDIDDSKLTRIITNNTLTWETPIENLLFTTRANIDYQVYNYKNYRNRIRGDGDSTEGFGWVVHKNTVTYVFQNSLDYSYEINDDHKLNFKLLQEFQKNRYLYVEADGESFADDGLTNLASAGSPTYAYSEFTDWAIASYMATAHYSAFNAKYVLDGTYRREGSSRFSPKNRWGNFWSVGAAWNIYKESFLADSNIISNLKLRASYGVTGNANINLNQYQALFGYDAGYGGEGAVVPSNFGNNDLSWETSNTLDVGMDFGLFKNRITGSFGYYARESNDLLLNVPLSLTTSFASQTRNIGSMENKGIELEMNFNIIQSEDLNFSIGGNMATTRNKVLELAKDGNGNDINITGTTQRVEVGHPVYGWYMPTWAGVDPANGKELWYVDGVGSATTSTFNSAKQVWQGGSAIPKLTAGLNLHVDYKGFSLDASGYYAGGHKVYEEWHLYTQSADIYPVVYYQGLNTLLDRWQQPGDTGTRFGKFEFKTHPWQRHSKFLYDGDYFRIKDVTFGYDLNSKVTDLIGFDGIRLFVRGTNVFTWVKDDLLLYDPEVQSTGFTSLTTPPVKSIIFGINVKF